MGALLPWASSTRRMICARAVSRRLWWPRSLIMPQFVQRGADHGSPGFFSTGIDSPVSIDSSTAERPSITTPSTGIFSPGRTMTTSPTITSSTGMSCSDPVSQDHLGSLGAQPHQLLDRLAGAAFGAGFQELAQPDQGDDHGGSFQVDVPAATSQTRPAGSTGKPPTNP